MTARSGVGSWLRLGLVVVMLAAALTLLVVRVREFLSSGPVAHAARGPVRFSDPAPAGPAMRIDPRAPADAGRERQDNALHMKLRWCPAGSFHMGRLPDAYRRYQEMPAVAVTLGNGFWMGRYEVSQAQWQQVMGLTLREMRARDPRQPRPHSDGSTRDHVGLGPDYPVYYVNFDEAEEFCRKLTDGEREAGRLEPGWEYRLPDEAQWEYACRAGTTTATAFGDRLDGTLANFDGTQPFGGAPAGPYLHETTPVGSYAANAWGLSDMHGNVWEWCRNFFDREPAPRRVPTGSPSVVERPYRGGCWHNPGQLCLSTTRDLMSGELRGSGLGFRVALVTGAPGAKRVP